MKLLTINRRLFSACSFGLLLYLSLWNICQAGSDTDPVLMEKIWKLIENSNIDEAQSLLYKIDPVSNHNELSLYRGAIFWQQKNYQQSNKILSEIMPFYDQRHEDIQEKRIDLVVNHQARQDELNYLRLYIYLSVGKVALGQRNEITEKYLLNVMANLPMAAESSAQYSDAISHYAYTEFALGKYERALGAYLQTYYILNRRSLEDTEYARLVEYNIACTYAKMGQADETVMWLKKVILLKPEKSILWTAEKFWNLILIDHDLDGVRNDETFRKFIVGKGLRQ